VGITDVTTRRLLHEKISSARADTRTLKSDRIKPSGDADVKHERIAGFRAKSHDPGNITAGARE
jgi:hypothetical protein